MRSRRRRRQHVELLVAEDVKRDARVRWESRRLVTTSATALTATSPVMYVLRLRGSVLRFVRGLRRRTLTSDSADL